MRRNDKMEKAEKVGCALCILATVMLIPAVVVGLLDINPVPTWVVVAILPGILTATAGVSIIIKGSI